jgi:hypothetical protein
MKINPQIAMMIFQGLQAASPTIKKAIPNLLNYNQGANITNFPNLTNAINNQYDLPLMDENISDIGYWDWDDGGDPRWQRSLGYEVLSQADDVDYNPNYKFPTQEAIDGLQNMINDPNQTKGNIQAYLDMLPTNPAFQSAEVFEPDIKKKLFNELINKK